MERDRDQESGADNLMAFLSFCLFLLKKSQEKHCRTNNKEVISFFPLLSLSRTHSCSQSDSIGKSKREARKKKSGLLVESGEVERERGRS